MKKIYGLILLLMLLVPINVFAVGSFSVSNSNITMYVGESKTVTVSASNSTGRLDISSTNSGVAGISIGSIFLDKDSSSITISGNSVGSAIVSVVASANYATYDEEILAGQRRTITVNVIAKPTSQPDPTPTVTPNLNNKPNTSNSTNDGDNTNDDLSTNNNLKKIAINGYDIVKVDNNNYTLTVGNNVTSIEITAEAEDSKAKVSGAGKQELKIGENSIDVIVTSESGVENKINIKVTRKDAYYLEDLKSALEDKKNKNIDISILEGTKISSEDLIKIKDSKKIVNLNYYDENKKLIYSWILDGSKIKKATKFETDIIFDSSNKEDIYKLANYADGKYLNFKHNGDLPEGTKIKLFVGDKFKDGSVVNIYHYNKENKKLDIVDNVTVKDGYLEFSIKSCSDYFITMSNINSVTKSESSINIFLIIAIIEFLIICVVIIMYISKVKSIGKSKGKKEIESTDFVNDEQKENKFDSLINNDNHEYDKIDEVQYFENNENINPLNQNIQDNNPPINNINLNDSMSTNDNFNKEDHFLEKKDEVQHFENNENINPLNQNIQDNNPPINNINLNDSIVTANNEDQDKKS